MPTLAKSGSDSMRAPINFFILGMTLIVFNGLKTLTTLKDLSFTDPKESSNILLYNYLEVFLPRYNNNSINKIPSYP